MDGKWGLTNYCEAKKLHAKWVNEEGGIEHPTHLETLLQPEQQKRIAWLKKHCFPATEILEVGCNWGYILNEVGGKCGIDINPENIKKAKAEFPSRRFKVGNACSLPFKDDSFAIVTLPDILEHLSWKEDVIKALDEALRVAKRKVLITLPYRQDDKCAGCFKHRWIPDGNYALEIIMDLVVKGHRVSAESDSVFIYIEVIKC